MLGTMQTRSLALVAGIALAVVAWYAFGRSAGAPPAPSLPAPAAAVPQVAPPALDVLAPAAPAEPEARRESVAVVPEAPSQEPDRAESAAPQPAFRLSGTVVVVDWNGVELEPIDGQFQLAIWEQQPARTERVEVTRGEWSIDMTLAAAPEIGVFDLATAQDALSIERPQEGSRVPFPDGGRLEIRARRARPSILRVVDARDGRALGNLELLRARWEDLDHPGISYEEHRIGSNLVSPIDLCAVVPLKNRRQQPQFFVGADGFAWERITVDFLAGGERTVALAPGGDLEVTLSGLQGVSGAALRLRSPASVRPIGAVDASTGEWLFRGLHPGPLRAAVEVGEWWASPLELGASEVTILEGQLVRTSIAAQEPPPLETASARGRLLVPSAWKARPPRIAAELLGTPLGGSNPNQSASVARSDERREGFDVFEWSFSKLQVGRHELSISKPVFSVVIDVPPTGLADHEVAVPPPGELLVRVVDARTDLDVETQPLQWHPRRPEGSTGGSLEVAKRDPRTGLYRIVAPATWIELHVWDLRYPARSESVDLSPGRVEYTLRMEPAHTLEIVLKDGETLVPFPEGFDGNPEPAGGGSGRVTLAQFDRFARRFQLTDAGRWTFQAPTPPGYRTPALATIEVRSDGPTQHEIELESL